MFGSERIPILEADISDLRQQADAQRAKMRGLVNHGRQVAASLEDHFASPLEDSVVQSRTFLESLPQHHYTGWTPSQWSSWEPPISDMESVVPDALPTNIRIGDFVEGRGSHPGAFSVPAFVPFIGQNQTIIIQSQGVEQHAAAVALLQSLLIRSALMLPHQTTYTLLDPAGNGAAFPMRRHLASVRENSGDARRDLERVIQDIQRINEFYLDASSPSLEMVDAKLRVNEKFQFVFAADFPNKYDRRAIEALQSVANTGPRTGTYVFIHHNTDVEMPRDLTMKEFRSAFYIDMGAPAALATCKMQLRYDGVPEPAVQDTILQKLRNVKAPERKVGAELIIQKELWTENASDLIKTPIGISGASGTLELWFGANDQGVICAHGMLGAMTGSGKSNLYHVLILGLCTRYSPSELRLFLIDGKDGVEFQPYRDLPHAEVVSLKSSPQLSRSVLAELVAERERRNKIFSDARVTDLTQYRRAGQPAGNLPRILLLVDEYQELFEGDKEGEASALLLQIAQQGRSAGIHMLLGSQRFGAPGMLNQTAIFGNVHLRMAMQMTNSDIQALTEFGRRGKQAIMHCDMPGKIVVNDRSGDDAGNKEGKVAYLSSSQRQQIIDLLIEKARDTLDPTEVPTTIVFDGKAQPNLIENPYVNYLLHQPCWLTSSQFETLARKPVYDGGLDAFDWFAAEHPKVIWLGQDFSVRGEAAAIIRRRTSEHVMIIGGANAARYGMLAAALATLAINVPPGNLAFIVFDRSVAGTSWNHTLENVVDQILKPAGFAATFERDTASAVAVLDRVLVEMDKRRTLNEDVLGREASIFVVMTDLDRVDELRRRADTYGMSDSPLGQKLNRIIVEGPALGVHLLLSFSGVRPMTHVLDERRTLLNFRHRIALQMSEDESLTYVRSRKAAQLQSEGPAPVCALYLDVENDRTLRFKPYSIEATIPFTEQINNIGQQLVQWRKTQ